MSQDIQTRLPELKRLAEAATPGPWTAQGPDDEEQKYHWSVRCPSKPPLISHELCRLSSINSSEEEDATYIAAANPAILLVLIAHIEALERQLAETEKRIQWEQNRAGRIGTHGPDCHTWGPSHYECAMRQLADLRQAERQAPEWISVKDRLPESGQCVLGFWETNDGIVWPSCFSTTTFLRIDHWHNPEDDEDDYACPTSWVPLPAAPSAGQAKPDADQNWQLREGDQFAIPSRDMILCETCGNKRCPHANDKAYACTGSNEPGQPGSAYP